MVVDYLSSSPTGLDIRCPPNRGQVPPWYVLPTDNKKYARMALKFLIVDALRHLELSWPAPDFDPEQERQRILDAE